MGKEKEKIKKWYGGFTFGKCQNMYSPWCITNFLNEERYRIYWSETRLNVLISRVFREGGRGLKISLTKLLLGEHIWCHIGENLLEDWQEDDENSIWDFLVACGYMKIVPSNSNFTESSQDTLQELEFVNFEVQKNFLCIVENWFGSRYDYKEFVKAMLNNNIEDMTGYLERVVLRYYDSFHKGTETTEEKIEKFYYGMALLLAVELREEYRFVPYYESGMGKYDVIFEPKDAKGKAVVLEFKTFRPTIEESLENSI